MQGTNIATVGIWIEWLNDEEKLANSIEQMRNVVAVYQRAIKDYLCTYLFAINMNAHGSVEGGPAN
jgi:hypothetical protein